MAGILPTATDARFYIVFTFHGGRQLIAQDVKLGVARFRIGYGVLADPTAAGELEKVVARIRRRVHRFQQVSRWRKKTNPREQSVNVQFQTLASGKSSPTSSNLTEPR